MSPPLHQYKTLEDIREYVNGLEEQWFARPILRGEHPTLHPPGDNIIEGIQDHDYEFSADKKWIEPDDQKGLSFSSKWQHLKGIYKMRAKRNQGQDIDVYWTIDDINVPQDMAFVADRSKKGHYFLTVTKRMTVGTLADKLSALADRMGVIKNSEVALS